MNDFFFDLFEYYHVMLIHQCNDADNTFTFYQIVAAFNCFVENLQFWKSFPSFAGFRSAEVKMAGGMISRDFALAKMGARGRISRELTILLKEPPLGCSANLKVLDPRMKLRWKEETLRKSHHPHIPHSSFIKSIFISRSVQDMSLFEWVATVEGPSDTPYQVFDLCNWITTYYLCCDLYATPGRKIRLGHYLP